MTIILKPINLPIIFKKKKKNWNPMFITSMKTWETEFVGRN